MNIHNQDKTKLVNSVFDKVYKNYDLMNDLMSFGIHRFWKKNLIDWMNPQPDNKIIDVASGTGDLAKIISEKSDNQNIICCVEPNKGMLETGKEKLKSFSPHIPSNIEKNGNFVSATLPILISQDIKKKPLKNKEKIVLCGFGVGLAYSFAIIEVNKKKIK